MVDSGSDRLVLTDRRLILFDLTSKNDDVKDLTYSHISSIEQTSEDKMWLLGIGVLLGLGGAARLYGVADNIGLLLLISGVVLVAAYYYTKKSGLVFITAAEELVYGINGTESESIAKDVFKTIRGYK